MGNTAKKFDWHGGRQRWSYRVNLDCLSASVCLSVCLSVPVYLTSGRWLVRHCHRCWDIINSNHLSNPSSDCNPLLSSFLFNSIHFHPRPSLSPILRSSLASHLFFLLFFSSLLSSFLFSFFPFSLPYSTLLSLLSSHLFSSHLTPSLHSRCIYRPVPVFECFRTRARLRQADLYAFSRVEERTQNRCGTVDRRS